MPSTGVGVEKISAALQPTQQGSQSHFNVKSRTIPLFKKPFGGLEKQCNIYLKQHWSKQLLKSATMTKKASLLERPTLPQVLQWQATVTFLLLQCMLYHDGCLWHPKGFDSSANIATIFRILDVELSPLPMCSKPRVIFLRHCQHLFQFM